jgi:hypothetical protein
MKTLDLNQVAVVNTTATAGIAVTLGKLAVTAGAVTNQGWGESVEWADVLGASLSAYAAAVKPVKRVNFGATGVVIPAQSAITVRIKAPNGMKNALPAGAPLISPYEVPITYYTGTVAPTAAFLAAEFYSQYLTMFAGVAGLPWTMTYTAGNTYFDITTSFADNGNVNLFQYDSAVTVEGLTASGVAVSISGVSTNATAVFTTAVAHGLSVGDVIHVDGLVGTGGTLYADINGYDCIILSTPLTTTFTCSVNGVTYNSSAITFSSAGTLVDLLYGTKIQMVQPVGTADQVLRDVPNMYVAGNTYDIISVLRRKFRKGGAGMDQSVSVYDVIYCLFGQSFATPAATTANAFTAVFRTIAAPALYLAK